MSESLKEELVAIGLDIATANWTSAATSGTKVVFRMWHTPERTAKRSATRAVRDLDAWLKVEGVSTDDLSEGLRLARTAAATTPEALADLVVLHQRSIPGLSTALLSTASPEGEASKRVATIILDTVLKELMKDPSFTERLDATAQLGAQRRLQQIEERSKHSAETAAAAVADRDNEIVLNLQRHTDGRLEGLLSEHRDRMWNGRLLAALRSLVATPDAWREEVIARKSSIYNAMAGSARSAGRAQEVVLIDTGGSYESVRGRLRRMQSDILAEAETLVPEEARQSTGAASQWLRDQIKDPSYRTAVLVTGRWGSGKSRVAAELATALWETKGRSVIVLRPTPSRTSSLSESLLEEASQAMGTRIATVSGLTAFLDAHQLQAVVVIDDLDQYLPLTGGSRGITQLIADSTVHDRLRWVLTIDSWRLDRVLSSSATPIWVEYSSTPPQSGSRR